MHRGCGRHFTEEELRSRAARSCTLRMVNCCAKGMDPYARQQRGRLDCWCVVFADHSVLLALHRQRAMVNGSVSVVVLSRLFRNIPKKPWSVGGGSSRRRQRAAPGGRSSRRERPHQGLILWSPRRHSQASPQNLPLSRRWTRAAAARSHGRPSPTQAPAWARMFWVVTPFVGFHLNNSSGEAP
jgi:hypothetical protein